MWWLSYLQDGRSRDRLFCNTCKTGLGFTFVDTRNYFYGVRTARSRGRPLLLPVPRTRKISATSSWPKNRPSFASACFLLNGGSFIGLFLYLEYGENMFLRNAGWFSTDYTAGQPRRKKSWLTYYTVFRCRTVSRTMQDQTKLFTLLLASDIHAFSPPSLMNFSHRHLIISPQDWTLSANGIFVSQINFPTRRQKPTSPRPLHGTSAQAL